MRERLREGLRERTREMGDGGSDREREREREGGGGRGQTGIDGGTDSELRCKTRTWYLRYSSQFIPVFPENNKQINKTKTHCYGRNALRSHTLRLSEISSAELCQPNCPKPNYEGRNLSPGLTSGGRETVQAKSMSCITTRRKNCEVQ